MNLPKTREDLAEAERAVTEARERVKSEAALIDELKADGP